MRLESLPPRTGLLAVTAGWTLLVWLLAMTGLGGRVASPSNLKNTEPESLPTLPEPVRERVGNLEQYAGIAARPIFSIDRLPKAFQLARGTEPTTSVDVRITGILITPSVQLATLQTTDGKSLRLHLDGPEVAGWRLLSLQPRTATVAGPSGTRTLVLHPYPGGYVRPAQPRPPVPSAGILPAQSSTSGMSATLKPVTSTTTSQEQIENIRQRIEARRQQLAQDGDADGPASRDTH